MNLWAKSFEQVRHKPGLVGLLEVQRLRNGLRLAAFGRQFVLALGDSSDLWECAVRPQLVDRTRMLSSLRKYLAFMLRGPIVPIELIAGSDILFRTSALATGRQLLSTYEAARATLEVVRASPHQIYAAHREVDLYFEEALLRQCPVSGGAYASSGHLLWLEPEDLVGDSDRVELARDVLNPVGLRVTPDTSPDDLVSICRVLNPTCDSGKVVLVTSFGRRLERLRPLIRAVQEAHGAVLWMCDPLRENKSAAEGVVAETKGTVAAHSELGGRLGGVYWDGADWPRNAGASEFTCALQICSALAHALRGFQ